jgi:hypothetical protein
VSRLAAVLFVCLAVQLSAATAPFVHQHARPGHHDDHDRTPAHVVHRHLTPHGGAGDHHDDDEEEGTAPQGDLAELTAWSAAVSAAAGVMSAHLETRATLNAPVTEVVAIEAPTVAAASPDEDVGSRVPRSPDFASSALRGPPR